MFHRELELWSYTQSENLKLFFNYS